MIIRGNYGTVTFKFGAGDRLIAMEVQRGVHQRPVYVCGGFQYLPVPQNTNSQMRMILYRGPIGNETSGQITSLASNGVGRFDWAGIPNFNANVFADFVINNDSQQHEVSSFELWPDDLVRVDENQVLGAACIIPVDMTTGADVAGANVVLTFIGRDDPQNEDQDVRKLKVK